MLSKEQELPNEINFNDVIGQLKIQKFYLFYEIKNITRNTKKCMFYDYILHFHDAPQNPQPVLIIRFSNKL